MDEELQIKKLDALFFLFREEEVGIAITFIKDMMLGKGYTVSDVEITRYITQLVEDKYIMPTTNGKKALKYIIRIEGYLFDGYEQKVLNGISESARLETIANELRANRLWILYLTILIAVGTLVAAIYYTVEILDKFAPVLHQRKLYWIWEIIPK
jgi:hypothetical protein